MIKLTSLVARNETPPPKVPSSCGDESIDSGWDMVELNMTNKLRIERGPATKQGSQQGK
jgi:hypothetical protein